MQKNSSKKNFGKYFVKSNENVVISFRLKVMNKHICVTKYAEICALRGNDIFVLNQST